MRVYSLGSPYGVGPCEDFAKGSNGVHIAKPFALFEGDPITTWGQLRGAKELQEKSKQFYRIDHAYRGRLEYFRVTRQEFQPSVIVPRPKDRWDALCRKFSIKMGDWRKGKSIVVALSDPKTYAFFGVSDFASSVESEIRKHTDRPIIFRDRYETRNIGSDLSDAWALVTFASNSVIDALLAGVPVFPLGPSISRPMGFSDLSKIEAPLYPENRDEFFSHVAYCQFTRAEFASGFALKTVDENWASGTRS